MGAPLVSHNSLLIALWTSVLSLPAAWFFQIWSLIVSFSAWNPPSASHRHNCESQGPHCGLQGPCLIFHDPKRVHCKREEGMSLPHHVGASPLDLCVIQPLTSFGTWSKITSPFHFPSGPHLTDFTLVYHCQLVYCLNSAWIRGPAMVSFTSEQCCLHSQCSVVLVSENRSPAYCKVLGISTHPWGFFTCAEDGVKDGLFTLSWLCDWRFVF